jgi:hypothetical protein
MEEGWIGKQKGGGRSKQVEGEAEEWREKQTGEERSRRVEREGC